MRRQLTCLTANLIFFLAVTAAPVFSGNQTGMDHSGGQMDHGSQAGMGHGGGQMDPGSQMGDPIRTTTVDGYQMAYRLIDMQKQIEKMPKGHGMQGAQSMAGTHHLMVFIQGPDGQAVGDAQVGYLVEGPDGSTQKRMCMGMSGGFGADVSFMEKGVYTVKTKAVAGGRQLMDTFSYQLE